MKVYGLAITKEQDEKDQWIVMLFVEGDKIVEMFSTSSDGVTSEGYCTEFDTTNFSAEEALQIMKDKVGKKQNNP